MDNDFKEYVKLVSKVYHLLEVSEEDDEATLEYLRENQKLLKLTLKFLKEIENEV